MKIMLLVAGVLLGIALHAQTQNVATLHETAKSFLRQGDYENSILVLNKALQLQPNDKELSKDLLFSYYLKRDFAKAMEIGKTLTERSDADVQTFHMLGLTYKAIAENKEAEKLYRKGMKQFPNEGILYSEFGEMIADKQADEALKLWEKGIEADPNHTSNYYFAAKQYAQKGDAFWSLLYAEIFLNMESFTPRSTEMKNLLLDQYKKFYTGYTPTPPPAVITRKGKNNTQSVQNDFGRVAADLLYKQQAQTTLGITPETLTVIRTRFILEWYEKYADKYPFRLFEHQRQLLKEGMFEAYNYWLFGPAANLKAYQLWQQYHKEELNTFLTFIRSKVFKVPSGQQYKTF